MSSARAHLPELPAPPSLQKPPVERHTLPNGLDVCVVERRELPVVDVRVIVRGGAAGDAPAHAGRAFMLGDLLDQGTQSRSALDIADEAELIGATLETRATWDAFAIALHVLTPRLDPALELLADVVLRPAFPEPDLERRRSERLAAILQERDEPRTVATHAFNRHAYPSSHPFAAPLAGTRETITALRRTDLTGLYGRRFAPGNAFVVVVGDVAAADAVARLERLFGEWHGNSAALPEIGPALPSAPSAVHIVDRPAAPQSELRVGRPGPPRLTADFFPLLVANTVLGGSFTSRLNMRLREEKAYTYGAGSSFALRAAGGPFLASTAVATAATADAIDVMVTEIARMSAERVPADELERAKSYLVLGLPRTFETTGDIAEHVSEVALHGLGDDWWDRYAERVDGVEADEVRDAAERWLGTDGLTLAIAGDAGAIRAELEALGIGEVNVERNG